jgi:hypothetical protein
VRNAGEDDSELIVSRLVLIASRDDYLLEESVARALDDASTSVGGVDPEVMPDDVTPETVAVELRSPSLFSPTRVLMVPDVRSWLGAPAPPGAATGDREVDVEPLLSALADGVPDGVALVMGAWCGRRPKGPLVAAVEGSGRFEWIPVPEPPKPWENVLLSDEQRTALRRVLAGASQGVRFTPDAERLLLERLGFHPRLLVQEARKLATAAGDGEEVDEGLVRELTFPRERSLEVVRDAVLERDAHALLDLIGAAAAGVPVRDWQGQRLDSRRLPPVVFAQVFNQMQQLLYLRGVAVSVGLEEELDPARTSDRAWYSRRFKNRLAPVLLDRLRELSPTPLDRGGKPPTPYSLGGLFAGAGRYREDELVAALAAGGAVEANLRGQLALEALSAWLTRFMGSEKITL